MSGGDRFAPRSGQRWTGCESGRWESAHRPDDEGTCTHWDAAKGAYCLTTEGVRLFAQGLRCPLHTPARLRGAPEPRSTAPVEVPEWGEAA